MTRLGYWLAGAVLAACLQSASAQDSAEEDAPPLAPTVTDPDTRALIETAQDFDFEADPHGTLAAWRAAYDAVLSAAPDDRLAVAQIANQLGAALYYAGEREGALPYFSFAAETFGGAGPEMAENHQEALGNVASILGNLGQLEESERVQREALEIRRTLYPEDHPQIARSYFEIGSTIGRRGRIDEAVELVERALAIRERVLPEGHPHIAMTQVSLASLQTSAHRYDEAVETARGGLERLEATLPPEHPFVAFAKSNYAGALNAAGRHAEAEPLLRQILADRRATLGDNHPRVAESLNNLAVALQALGDPAAARPLFLAAHEIEVTASGADSADGAEILLNAADAAALTGDHDQAAREWRQVLDVFDRTGVDTGLDRARLLVRLATHEAGHGEPELARAYIAEARSLADDALPEGHENRLAFAIDEAWVGWRTGQAPADALAAAEDETWRLLARASGVDIDRAGDAVRRRQTAYARALDLAAATDDANLVLALLDARGQAGLGLAAEAAAQRDADGAVRAAQDAARQVRLLEERYIRQRADSTTDSADMAATGQALDDARQRLADRVGSLPGVAPGTANRSLADSLPGRLAPGQAALAFAFTETGGVVAAITPDGVVLARPGISDADAARDVAALRRSLSGGIGQVRDGEARAALDALNAFDAVAAHRLYAGVFPPEIEAALTQTDHLTILPSGAYVGIPFTVLLAEPYGGRLADDAALRRAPWLIRRYALSSAVSLATLASAEPARDTGGPARLLGVGAPAFNGPSDAAGLNRLTVRGGTVDLAELGQLPPLPGARAELEALASRFGPDQSTLLIGPAATERALRAAPLPDIDVLVIATHGLLPGAFDNLTEPALALTPPAEADALDDGLLTAPEIASLELDADWVVLSACNTFAAHEATPADRLAAAFLYAGARALLVSHWTVRDDVAARLTAGTVAASGETERSQAFRQAVLDLMEDESVPAGAHPAVWGPFALIGR